MKKPASGFTIATSSIPGAGRGLFSRSRLEKGDRLEVVGTLVRPGSMADRSTRYADAYKFRVGGFLLIPTGCGAMVNHSASPNMEKIVRGRRLHLRALVPIPALTELLFTYSAYAQERFGLAGPVRPVAY